MNELLLAYLTWARTHNVAPDGRPSPTFAALKRTLLTVRDLFGLTPADQFSPVALKSVRDHWVNARHSRKVINDRVGDVRRAFK